MTDKKMIAVVGDLLLDLSLYLDRPVGSEEESVVVREVHVSPGGVAGNVSVALSRLGARARVVSAVGRDVLGAYLLGRLREEGVDAAYIRQLDAPTGFTVVLVKPGGSRALFSYRGASGELELDYETALSVLSEVVHVFVSGYVLHSSRGAKTLSSVLRAARRLGLEVSIDIGGIPGLDSLVSIPGTTGVDYLFLNVDELRALTGTEDYFEGIDLLESALKPKAVFLKMGSKGSMVKAGESLHYARAFRVKPVDTTGCGDAFNAGVIYALTRGYSFRDALELGNLIGAYKATGKGAQHLPRDLNELLEFKKRIEDRQAAV